jgi:NhaP-type Na+/H+ or K+/H+ antiporter
MHLHLEIVLLAVLTCTAIYSLLTKVIAKTSLTLPIIFTGVGYLVSYQVNGLSEPQVLRDSTRLLAEVTLILVLFSDASHVKLERLRENYAIPARMLALGLPLTLALGTAVAWFLNPGSGVAMALLTAAVLTPTDAALGQIVVSSPDVPKTLSQAINVESGLNDGLVLPFVLFGAMMTASSTSTMHADGFAVAVLLQIVLGPLVGLACGWGLAKAMDFAQTKNLMAESASGIVFLSAAFMSYVGAEIVGGNGFIAAFIAGMVFGNVYKHEIHFIGEFMEGVGQALTMLAFLAFGALLLPAGILHMQWKAIVLALLFLTVVRMVPIWISLAGSGLATRDRLFLGWFGPRGLASILFTMIITDEFDIPGEAELLACVSMTVFLSVVLHGATAAPLSRWIGKSPKAGNMPI